MRFPRLMKCLAVALLLPMSGVASLSGCVVHEKERVVEHDRPRVVVERPRVVERDTTVIERR